MKVVLTGGGSGGHISPALAVAKLLKEDQNTSLLYIGGRMTMEGSTGASLEEQLVKPTGIPYVNIRVGKLRRGGFSLATIKRLWGVFPGFFEAIRHLRSFKPDVVFASGGYVSLPVVIAASLLRIPIVIHEQTAVVGLANKISARYATKIAITFPQSAAYFPTSKTVVTGNPLRPEVLQPNPKNSQVMAWLQSTSKQLPLLYITGGGQGSHIINTTIEAILPELLTSYRIIHQCGAHVQFADYERLIEVKNTLDSQRSNNYFPSKFFTPDEVGAIYQQADLAIARSGANTVLELAAVGLPAIFIPIPWVTHDEQTHNAQVLVEVGLARILPEADLSPQSLQSSIEAFMQRLPQLDPAKVKAKEIVDLNAASSLVALLQEVASST